MWSFFATAINRACWSPASVTGIRLGAPRPDITFQSRHDFRRKYDIGLTCDIRSGRRLRRYLAGKRDGACMARSLGKTRICANRSVGGENEKATKQAESHALRGWVSSSDVAFTIRGLPTELPSTSMFATSGRRPRIFWQNAQPGRSCWRSRLRQVKRRQAPASVQGLYLRVSVQKSGFKPWERSVPTNAPLQQSLTLIAGAYPIPS